MGTSAAKFMPQQWPKLALDSALQELNFTTCLSDEK
jgi:hypothetical protein